MAQHKADLHKRLAQLLDESQTASEHILGFPAALDYDHQELTPWLHQFLNNVGDPFVEPFHAMTTKQLEIEVLEFFAELFRAPKNDWWGYITNGSTECNLYALYVARETLPGTRVYYSQAAHYSVPKNIHILGCTGEAVATLPSGEMDYADLAKRLRAHGDKHAIVIATIGTTMTEAKDNVAEIAATLRSAGVTRSYIHADAALAGPYTALLEPRWPFDFADGADSVSISGHKFMGCPMACGVVLVRKSLKDALRQQLNYTGTPDTTISGSRNGHSALLLWYATMRQGREGIRQRAEKGLNLAEYAHQQLQRIGWHAWRNPNALTVMLKTPSEALIRKWQLASANGWSHIICMPSVTKSRIDSFIQDLSTTR
jgi:histidine decarboxylase